MTDVGESPPVREVLGGYPRDVYRWCARRHVIQLGVYGGAAFAAGAGVGILVRAGSRAWAPTPSVAVGRPLAGVLITTGLFVAVVSLVWLAATLPEAVEVDG